MKGIFISFEGSEGCGKSTQVALLLEQLIQMRRPARLVREPGGTPIGEEIRHTLKHSASNQAMTPEAELLLMNASRAQLVREIIRPALSAGEVVLCDRFYDSTLAYQGYGRGLDLKLVRAVIEVAVEDTHPDLTLLLRVPPHISAERMAARQAKMPAVRDRFEEADRDFFDRVNHGYEAIAASNPRRIRILDASSSVEHVQAEIWRLVEPLLSA